MHKVPFYKPNIPKSTIKRIKSVIDSGWITTGPLVREFESEFGKTIEANRCVAVSSCTAALHLSYIAAGLKPGDEVLIPSFAFCSAINFIIHAGATPVFCDIKEDTLCVDSDDIKRKINKKTKAIVVIHFAGMPADMDAINKIARDNKLVVIEDAAHAFLTKYRGKWIGNSKNYVCFSFYATKNLTTAEGGMISCVTEEQENLLRRLSSHGISKSSIERYGSGNDWEYDVLYPGFKYNMTDIQAAFGMEQLPYAMRAHTKRARLVNLYRKYLSSNENLILPIDPPFEDSEHAWHLFTIRLKSTVKITRDELIKKLKESGIGTSVHFIPYHTQTLYKKLSHYPQKLPITERVYNSILTLPLYENLTETDIRCIVGALNKWAK